MARRTAAIFMCGLLASMTMFASVNCVPAGAAAGTDIELIRNVKNYVLPSIIKQINAFTIPHLDYNGGYVEGITFNF